MSVASLVFAVSALLVKLTHARVPTFEIVAVRSSLSFVACAWGAHQAGVRPLLGHRANWPALVGRGMFGAAVSACKHSIVVFQVCCSRMRCAARRT
jgi:drug/metabolite transporter (DMT)-like permease